MLASHFSVFPQGIFVSEDDGHVIGFACAIRTTEKMMEEPIAWSDIAGNGEALGHNEKGEWLYVSRLTYTAGPGHAPVTNEIGPLLNALKNLADEQSLAGVAIALRFHGFRERSGATTFQRTCIDDPRNQVRSAMNPIGVAYDIGFRHHLALPNYLGDARHFALMVWRRPVAVAR